MELGWKLTVIWQEDPGSITCPEQRSAVTGNAQGRAADDERSLHLQGTLLLFEIVTVRHREVGLHGLHNGVRAAQWH